MTRTFWMAVLLVLLPNVAWAMEHYTDRLTDSKGNSVKGALVYVYQTGTLTLATLYADNGITIKTNPITTSTAVETAGAFDFYAANGAYDLVFSKTDYTFDALLTRRITLFDPTAGGDGVCVNAQTGTTYTIIAGDRGCLVTFTNASPVTVTIPQAGTVGFETGFYFYALNLGDDVVDLVPVSSTIQGAPEITLNTGNSTQVVSDGTNYNHIPGSTGITGWPTDSTTKEVTWANALANAIRFGNGTDYWALYRDPTDGLQFICVIAGVANDCNYIRKLAAGKTFKIQNSAGTDIFIVTESTGALTNVKLDSEGTGNIITIPAIRWDLDLCAISPADSALSHVWNKDPLSTAPTLTAKAGTNRSTCVATFPDSDGDYGVAITRRLPLGFTGALTMEVWWDTTGTGNARFQVATKCYADNEVDDAAYNTASVITAAAGTSGRPNVAEVSGVTVTGCSGGELMRIRFFRNRTEASDTLNAALNVEKVYFTGFSAE